MNWFYTEGLKHSQIHRHLRSKDFERKGSDLGMGWLLLLGGISINISGVVGIKFAQVSSQQFLGVFAYFIYFLGFFVLSLSFKHLEVGMAYAVWSGLGSMIALGFGVAFFGESLSLSKMSFFVLTMIGIVGMSLQTQG